MNNLVFFQTPEVTFATNIFVNVPIILQYKDIPLIEVIKSEKTGFKTQIPIYYPDGTYVAKVVGSRIFTTEEGKKIDLKLKYLKNKTICELAGKTTFEITRTGPAAISVMAELFAPDGTFLKFSYDQLPEFIFKEEEKGLHIGGVFMSHNTFSGCRIGIWITEKNEILIGVG